MVPFPHVYVAIRLIQAYMNLIGSSDLHVEIHINIIEY